MFLFQNHLCHMIGCGNYGLVVHEFWDLVSNRSIAFCFCYNHAMYNHEEDVGKDFYFAHWIYKPMKQARAQAIEPEPKPEQEQNRDLYQDKDQERE